MKHTFIFFALLTIVLTQTAAAQKPKDGSYLYKVAFAGWGSKPTSITVLVKIKGDSVYIIHNGGNLSGHKGELIDSGIIMQHKRSGKWIIGHRPEDRTASEVGGCTDGPRVIDFTRKIFLLC